MRLGFVFLSLILILSIFVTPAESSTHILTKTACKLRRTSSAPTNTCSARIMRTENASAKTAPCASGKEKNPKTRTVPAAEDTSQERESDEQQQDFEINNIIQIVRLINYFILEQFLLLELFEERSRFYD